MQRFDLIIGTTGRVKALNNGFFEKSAELSLAPMPETVIIGNYRMKKSEYEHNRLTFDYFLFERGETGNPLLDAIIRFIRAKQIGTHEERNELIAFIWDNFNDEEGVEIDG